MLKNRNMFSLSLILIYGLSFLVLWEWLRPLPVITDTGNLYVFVWFTFFCFIFMYFRVVSYISVPIIFIAMMYGLHYIFFGGSFISEGFSTLTWFGEDLARNIEFLIASKMNDLSYEFRSFLLFLVLAIISYLIHFWIYHVKKIFFFLFITIMYVTILDTFTVYDASTSIVRLVVSSFLLMTLLFKMKLEETERIKADKLSNGAWISITTCMIAFVAVVAFFLPKYEPHWPDPLPMVQGAMSGENLSVGHRTIGYSDNDERLGGGFAYDDTVVFTAVANQGHYWRGESKEIYTGKGWESVEQQLNRTFRFSEHYNEKVSVQFYEQGTPINVQETTITMFDDRHFSHFFYPGELLEVHVDGLKFNAEFLEEPFQFSIDYVSGKVSTMSSTNHNPLLLQEYLITYKYPSFVIEHLKEKTNLDPDHIKEVYLQLPELPERIGILASEITRNYDNRYDKVKAVEEYFSKYDYKYETQDVAIPSEGQDYVDQFLFETRRGYCDNFSTSMVVMLRTLDIPARWVKGFTQGRVIGLAENGKKKYEITNANAHSWVEVYFPNVGWVPFEPTRGFNAGFEFVEGNPLDGELDQSGVEESYEQEQVPQRENDPENPFLPLEEEGEPVSTIEENITNDLEESSSKSFSNPFNWFPLLMLLVGFLFYKTYRRLITFFFLYWFKLKSRDENIYLSAYERLLWLLQLNGYYRYTDETLREYASRIDKSLSCTEMTRLTLKYEKIIYGNSRDPSLWKEMHSSWETILRKMGS
ncbi:transglutaminase TgpA family protein [Anaerobacillus alkalidiazotrophicus]|nr:transglutaminaseTgpA domain-containing protein [Anaerobacillus alkalidiazotrophicus]